MSVTTRNENKFLSFQLLSGALKTIDFLKLKLAILNPLAFFLVLDVEQLVVMTTARGAVIKDCKNMYAL